jgi:pimeloyl-ACP methyl ester carboxylesterase
MSTTNAAPVQATSTFFASSPGVGLFRWVLGTSQRLWPRLAVATAARLFSTPLPPRWMQPKHRWGSDWHVERWPFEHAGLTLYTRRADSDAPTVLLVHGWGGHARQMLTLAETLTQQGLHVVLLEMPAHGRSAGRVSNLPQFARALEYAGARLAQQGHRLRAVVAHSLSANAAAYAAARGMAVERLVLLAPPASPGEYTRLFAQVFGLSERTRAAMQARVEAREGILMPQFEPDAVGPRVRQPTLVVHDREDSINPFADGIAFAQAIRGARLEATQGLGHRKLLRDEAVLARVSIFLR